MRFFTYPVSYSCSVLASHLYLVCHITLISHLEHPTFTMNETLVTTWTFLDPGCIHGLISKLIQAISELASILAFVQVVRKIVEETAKFVLVLSLSTVMSKIILTINSPQSTGRCISAYRRFYLRVKTWFKCFLYYIRRREEVLRILEYLSNTIENIRQVSPICIVTLAAIIIQQIKAYIRSQSNIYF